MATWKLGTSTKEAPGNERPPTPEDEAAWDNGVVMNDGGYPAVRSALAENRRFGPARHLKRSFDLSLTPPIQVYFPNFPIRN